MTIAIIDVVYNDNITNKVYNNQANDWKWSYDGQLQRQQNNVTDMGIHYCIFLYFKNTH